MKYKIAIIVISLSNCRTLSAQSNTIGPGIALNIFSTSNSYIDMGDIFNNLEYPLTFEAWIFPTQFNSPFGGIYGSDNATFGSYYGCYVRLNSVGNLIFEMGDGIGAGMNNRRGKVTTTSVPLNAWTHVAVVVTNISNIKFYFNGVLQTAVSTDGTSNVVDLIHNVFHTSLGSYSTVWAQHNFIGILDELRLWDVARTQSEIRDGMCRKIDPGTSGLIAYWKADESYTGLTVEDFTVVQENGTMVGQVEKITSSAPLGDSSTYIYSSGWNGITLTESDASGDMVTVENIAGSPHGVHIYLVKSLPYFTSGLNSNPHFYFGIFCAGNTSIPVYDIVYQYDFNNGIINSGNEASAAIYHRDDAAVVNWSNANASLNISTNQASKPGLSNRGEYILDVPLSQVNFTGDTFLCEKFCADFYDLSGNNPVSWEWLFPGGIPTSSSDQNPTNICYFQPGIYDVTLITFSANGSDTLMMADYITVLPTPPFPLISQYGDSLVSSPAVAYQWQFNAVDIPGATNQYHIATSSGVYTIIIFDGNGCSNSVSKDVIISGFSDPSLSSGIFSYPNPADDFVELTVRSGIDEGDFKIRIFNSEGKEIYSLDQVIHNGRYSAILDLRNQMPGIYFVMVKAGNSYYTGKLIVTHF